MFIHFRRSNDKKKRQGNTLRAQSISKQYPILHRGLLLSASGFLHHSVYTVTKIKSTYKGSSSRSPRHLSVNRRSVGDLAGLSDQYDIVIVYGALTEYWTWGLASGWYVTSFIIDGPTGDCRTGEGASPVSPEGLSPLRPKLTRFVGVERSRL